MNKNDIRILAPMIGTRKKKDTEATKSKDSAAVNAPVLVGFRAVYVFDVSQTEGAELPDLSERVKGEVGEYRERLTDFLQTQGIHSVIGTLSHLQQVRGPPRSRGHRLLCCRLC
jgi:hypothetical protein